MKTENTEVLIVGAGPTGLLLACELARRSVAFRIIDRAARPSTLSRGLGVHSRALEIFHDLGLIKELLKEGFWLSGTSIYKDRKLMRRVPLDQVATDAEPYPSLLMVDQSRVEHVLTEELCRQGIEVERSCELKSFAQGPQDVSVTLSRNKLLERMRCRYLVGCDGPKSRVRETLGIEFAGFTYPKVYTLAEVRMDWQLPAEMHRFLSDSGDLLAIPMGEDRFRLTAWEQHEDDSSEDSDSPQHRSLASAPTVEHIQQLVDRTVPEGAVVKEANILMRYKMDLRLASSYGTGRCFIAGDACHVHPPTGAQGLNTGIQDAYNLGWKLASVVRSDCPRELLESYEAERRPVGHWVLNNTHRAANSRFELAGRRFFVLGQKFLMSRWNQLSVNYRNSTVVAQMEPVAEPGELQAGDRLPDGLLRARDGESGVRVFDLLRDPEHHLLVFPGKDESVFKDVVSAVTSDYGRFIKTHVIGSDLQDWPTESLWEDPEQKVTKEYSIRQPTLLFVRPDGYVGARVTGAMSTPFLHYLESCFLMKKPVG